MHFHIGAKKTKYTNKAQLKGVFICPHANCKIELSKKPTVTNYYYYFLYLYAIRL